MLALFAGLIQVVLAAAQISAALRGTRVRPAPVPAVLGILVVGALGVLIALFVGASTHPMVALAATTAISQFILWIGLRQIRAVARVHRWGAALVRAEPGRRRDLVARMLGAVPALGDRYEPGALRLRMHAASALAEAGEFAAAEELLDPIDTARLGGPDRVVCAASRAVCRLYAGDPEGAQRALDALGGDDAGAEAALCVTRALVTVLRGDATTALELVGRDHDTERELATSLGRARAVVRAHAFAALDDTEAARTALRALHRAHGNAALDRVVLLRGPASSLAAALRSEREAPYR